MNEVEAFRQKIKSRFLAGHPITIEEFYGQLDTVTLTRLNAGLERNFDAACGGDPYRQPKEWLQDRLNLMSKILEESRITAQDIPSGTRFARKRAE